MIRAQFFWELVKFITVYMYVLLYVPKALGEMNLTKFPRNKE